MTKKAHTPFPMQTISDPYSSRVGDAQEIKKRVDPVLHGDWQKRIGRPLNETQLTGFSENGYLWIERLFSQEEVSAFTQELNRLEGYPNSKKGPEYILEPADEKVRSIFQIHRSSPVFKLLSRDKRIADIARQILDSEVYIHQSRINLKRGFEGKEFYWHSDFETWHVEDGMTAMRSVSCSIALTDNFAFNGSLMVIPGSHRKYIACAGLTPDDNFKYSLRKQEYGVPDHEALSDLVDHGRIEMPTGPAGSVLFFDCNIMHGSNGNITPYPRTNVFYVFNSMKNKLVAPFGGTKPRPEHVATRETVEEVAPVQADYSDLNGEKT